MPGKFREELRGWQVTSLTPVYGRDGEVEKEGIRRREEFGEVE